MKLDVNEEQTEYQQDITALKAKERFSGVAPNQTTEEEEFLAQLLVHFSNGTRARKRSFSDDSNDEEIPLQVESRRKVVKVKRNGGLKDVRLPNACEVISFLKNVPELISIRSTSEDI